MKKKRLYLFMVLAVIIFISTACSPNVEKEIQPEVGEYKTTLNELYNELETKYEENPTPEDWNSFSKDWIPRITASMPEELNEDIPEEITGKVSQLNNAKNNLMYLWNEYNNKITGKKFKEENIQELKENIEKSLK